MTSVAVMEQERPSPPVVSIPRITSPGIATVDQQRPQAASRYLVVNLKSVYYYTTVSESDPADSILNCAVLIDIQFELADKDKLAYAKLPLKALGAETIPLPDISSYYPEAEQPYKLQEFLDNQTRQIMPKVNVGAVGVNIGIEGLGQGRERRATTSSYISLNPVFDQQKNCPAVLRWEFRGTNDADLCYPSHVKLLVIASKPKVTDSEVYFPFKLHLDRNLLVRLYDVGIVRRVKDYLGRLTANAHDGWQFQIDGKYQDHLAQQALRNAESTRNGRDYADIGLYAAMKAWEEENQRYLMRKVVPS